MSKAITFYEDSGLITGYIESNDPLQIEANKTGDWVYGQGEADHHYIKDGKITNRPTQQTTLTNNTLNNLPVPCTISINGTEYECDEDTVELEFDQPTTYQITVSAWPYLDWETTYENQT